MMNMYEIKNLGDTLDISINGVITDDGSTLLANDISNAAKAGVKFLTIHINSYGGSVKGAYDIVTAFLSNGLKVTAINEGFAISAASVILAAADYSIAYDYSMALIHDPLIGNTTLADTEGSTKNMLQAIKDGIIAIYQKRFKVGLDIISTMMSNETSMNAEEQKAIGLVNEVVIKVNKPLIGNNLEIIEIYNLYNEFRKEEELNENKINTMEEQEIVNVDPNADPNKPACATQMATCPDCGKQFSVDIPTAEVATPPAEPVTEPAVTPENPPVDVPAKNEVEILTAELNTLKVENFIMKNGLTDKSEMINAAVEKHGIEVLSTILNFTNINASKEVSALKDNLVNVVNAVNTELTDIINQNSKPVDKLALANSLFAIDGDSAKRIELKETDPELYNELFELYANS